MHVDSEYILGLSFTITPATKSLCFGFLPQVHITTSRLYVHRCMHPVHSISETFELLQWNHDCVQPTPPPPPRPFSRPPPPPPDLTDSWGGGVVASGPVVVAPP